MRFFTQSATILLANLFVLLVISTPLSSYMMPVLGIIIISSVIFIIIRQRTLRHSLGQEKAPEVFTGSAKEIFTVTVAILLAIFLTGGLQSNLFFLLYFLLFGIVFILEPSTIFVLLLGLMVVFYQSIFEGDMLSNLVKLGSLVFLATLGFFFGREFKRRENLEGKIDDKVGQILEDAKVLRDHIDDEEAVEEIEDITRRANELREEAKRE